MMTKQISCLSWRIPVILSLFVVLVLILSSKTKVIASTESFHTVEEYSFFTGLLDSLPKGYNSLFAASGECLQCHGFDTAMIASVDPFGNDINVVDDWRATMMANSAKDPFWRAKVSHEITIYPEHQQVIENSCTDCHAPLGHFAAYHQGATSYSIAEMINDSIALDGVSCLACHQQSSINLGNTHSGDLNFDTTKVAYGPYISPLSSPMLEATNYEPIYSEHINDAGVCAACHTLITETLDYDGNLTGNSFVEQATYHEWLNSTYNTENVTCQECHMPALEKGLFNIAAGFPAPPRNRFALHELAGANVTMLKLLRDNAVALGISASPQDFENVITATINMLRHRTLESELAKLERSEDTLFIAYKLSNLAGHKFPSGYPSRRAFVQLSVENEAGEIIFNSGQLDENFEVYGQNPTFEPHYNVIRSEDEVQIYEQVMGDVNDEVTTVLTRASYHIKDNRIPPLGFSSTHEVYDTTAIAGNALNDIDFNTNDIGEQGTGADVVYYHIPLLGDLSPLKVKAKVYYQSTPPKWMEEMFSESTEEIELFREQFAVADKQPTLVTTDSLLIDALVDIQEPEEEWNVNIFATGNGKFQINLPFKAEIKVYTLLGQEIFNAVARPGENTFQLVYKEQVVLVHLQKGDVVMSKKLWIP